MFHIVWISSTKYIFSMKVYMLDIDWINNLLSLVPKAGIKIAQLDLLEVATVFCSFILYLQICFSLFTFP